MENGGEIILMGLGTFVMTIIAVSLIFYVLYYGNKVRLKKVADELQAKQLQKEQYNALIQTQENEKLRIARNLHDEVKPMLAAIKNKLQIYQINYNNKVDEVPDYIDTIALVNQTYEIVGNTSHDLVPSFLVDDGIFRSIQFQLTQANNPKLKVDYFDFLPDAGENYFSHDQRLHIFRVVLEVFNNIIKHDGPKSITVSVEKENNMIIFIFTHNGNGVDNETINELKKKSRGLGLKSIHARIELLNGKINYFKGSDYSGVELFIPC